MFNAYLHYLIPRSPYIPWDAGASSLLATPRSAFAHICKPAFKPPNKKPRRAQRARNTRRGKTGAPVSTGPLGDHLQRRRGERWRVCPLILARKEKSPHRGELSEHPIGVCSVPFPYSSALSTGTCSVLFRSVPFVPFCSRPMSSWDFIGSSTITKPFKAESIILASYKTYAGFPF